MPSKHPVPLKTSSNSLCICCVDSALILLSLSQLGPAIKQFVGLCKLFLTIDFSLLLPDFEMLSVFVQYFHLLSFSCSVSNPWTSFMFVIHSSFFATLASIASMFMLIKLSASVSSSPSNACPFPGTTKNWHVFDVFMFYNYLTCS